MDEFRRLDQFFTPLELSQKSFNRLLKLLEILKIDTKDCLFIEPSVGSGNFYRLLENYEHIGIDITLRHYLRHKDDFLVEMNYLNWTPPKTKPFNILIGNPPFGFRGNLALKFIEHSYQFADVIAFILPKSFYSDGKGSNMQRIKGYDLVESIFLDDSKFLYPDGSEAKVSTVFQIWINSKKFVNHGLDVKNTISTIKQSDFRIFSLSDGGTPQTTRNKKFINVCDLYLPMTCYSSKMKIYHHFNDLPYHRGYGIIFDKKKNDYLKKAATLDWSKIAFKSSNGALNLRKSLIETSLFF